MPRAASIKGFPLDKLPLERSLIYEDQGKVRGSGPSSHALNKTLSACFSGSSYSYNELVIKWNCYGALYNSFERIIRFSASNPRFMEVLQHEVNADGIKISESTGWSCSLRTVR